MWDRNRHCRRVQQHAGIYTRLVVLADEFEVRLAAVAAVCKPVGRECDA